MSYINHTTFLKVSGISAMEFQMTMTLDSGVQVPILADSSNTSAILPIPFALKARVILRRVN